MGTIIIDFILILILLLVYFTPTLTAYARGHKNILAIFILNLFLGYTFVAWVIALIWAVYNTEATKSPKKK